MNMSAGSTELIKKRAQWRPKEESSHIPPATRGIYALLQKTGKDRYDVVYIGMTSRSSVGRRLARHKNSKKIWNHFSIFEVRDNIKEQQILELEGLFREIYRKDTKANRFNRIGKYGKLQDVRIDDLKSWNKKKQAKGRRQK